MACVCMIDITANCAAHTNTLQTTKVDTQIYCCKPGEITNWISNADLQTLRKLRSSEEVYLFVFPIS